MKFELLQFCNTIEYTGNENIILIAEAGHIGIASNSTNRLIKNKEKCLQ
jgi:hypothetical protein